MSFKASLWKFSLGGNLFEIFSDKHKLHNYRALRFSSELKLTRFILAVNNSIFRTASTSARYILYHPSYITFKSDCIYGRTNLLILFSVTKSTFLPSLFSISRIKLIYKNIPIGFPRETITTISLLGLSSPRETEPKTAALSNTVFFKNG